jgi:hypothetical protein
MAVGGSVDSVNADVAGSKEGGCGWCQGGSWPEGGMLGTLVASASTSAGATAALLRLRGPLKNWLIGSGADTVRGRSDLFGK